ncbi:hypothetical protein KDL44_02490 [bacterium]|nr:hypothetical protein [bacterium]
MAHAYVPGLKVTELTTVRKDRILPLKGDVLVKLGDTVTADQVVARTELPGPVKTLNVVNMLGVDPGMINDYMLKKPGESFTAGEVIAENKPFLGLKFLQTRITVDFDGSIDNVSDVTGQVILRYPPRLVEMPAYVDGKVVEVRAGEGVVVETHGSFVQGIFGVGGETHGELVMGVGSKDEILDEQHIKAEFQNRIVVGGSLLTSAAFEKCKQVGVKGVIVGGFHDKDLKAILGYDLGVAITGSEEIGLTLVMTEGFGEIAMADKTFNLLRKREGQRTSISGATQIRAGVMRPEVIIPTQGAIGGAEEAQQNVGTDIGAMVRCIREPYFGRIGRVGKLIPELTKVESETMVRVLEVEFDGGEKVVVPRANIEMIES